MKNLNITKEEENIFDMITSCKPENVIPRVAGGWVRDKLMNLSCYDMDIALENISGYEFAILLEKSFKNSVSSVSVIQSNPDKSKHLETAVCKINGLFVDFVNLRCEKYADTRIPTITLGTPQEDAYRRDLTINALFYNIITKEIEDHTGLGLQDIKDKVLRTPLNPLTTFSDDPLRILRIFRFKSKFDFSIQKDIYAALENKSLKSHLTNKVSKERIHIEIFKMINNLYGHKGIYEIIQNEYTESVFGLNNNLYDMVNHYEKISKFINQIDVNIKWIYNLYIIMLSSSGIFIKEKNKKIFLNVQICKKDLCSSTKICNIIKSIEEGIYRTKFLNFSDLSINNIYFILNVLGNYWHEIIKLIYIKNEDFLLIEFLKFVKIEKINYNGKEKPNIDIKNLDEKINIKKKYIGYFVRECIIFQQSKQEGKLLEYLKDNKSQIIDKYKKLEIP